MSLGIHGGAGRPAFSFFFGNSINWEGVAINFPNTLQSLTFHTAALPYSQPFGFSDKCSPRKARNADSPPLPPDAVFETDPYKDRPTDLAPPTRLSHGSVVTWLQTHRGEWKGGQGKTRHVGAGRGGERHLLFPLEKERQGHDWLEGQRTNPRTGCGLRRGGWDQSCEREGQSKACSFGFLRSFCPPSSESPSSTLTSSWMASRPRACFRESVIKTPAALVVHSGRMGRAGPEPERDGPKDTQQIRLDLGLARGSGKEWGEI